ncbi:hypothetical protein IFM89_031186 [Coptis chinensis]|uniref:Uncharacterized protein n=1 Tax=Coptis chinensis TaxID=261450 RepID=A0A835ISS5_9MAGN|nr:hypothetical protein IFM89_031186 [Coptis chinensis]
MPNVKYHEREIYCDIFCTMPLALGIIYISRNADEREMMMGIIGAFRGSRVMEIVKKNDSGGLLWKRIKLTTTRKANAKKRLLRVWQNEAVLKALAGPPPPKDTASGDVTMADKESVISQS